MLLAAMVVTMIIPPVQVAKAAEDPATSGKNAPIDFASSTTQVCPVCGGEAKEWKPLTAITANTALAGGHYYVPEGGISNKAQYNLNSNATRCIHLNGNTISSTAKVFNVSTNARLNLFGSGDVKSTATSTTGSVMYLSTARVYLYGGTVSAPKATTGNPVRLDSANAKLYLYDGATITSTGRSVQVSSGSVTMNGGMISGGASASSGGNVYMSDGSFTMKGGTITGGSSDSYGGNVYVGGTFTMSGGSVSNGNANHGGNVYVANAGSFSMTAGTVSGGNATTYGGNICATTSTFCVAGSILDGTAGLGGGNISVSDGSVLSVAGTVAGGTVTGTQNANWGGNIRAWHATVNINNGALIYGGNGGGKPGSANIGCLGEDAGKTAVLNLNGGVVVGDIHTSSANGDFSGTKVSIIGAPVVTKSYTVSGKTYTARQGLYVHKDWVVDITGMTGGSICVTGVNNQIVTTVHDNAALLKGCIVAHSTSQQVDLVDGAFYLVEKQGAGESDFAPEENDGKAICPICAEEKTWTAYSGTGTLGEQKDGAHIYLSGDRNATGANQVLSVAENATVCFNLNGKTLTMDGRIAIAKTGTTLNIMDTAGTGVVTTTGTRTESNLYNYTIVNQNDGVINLYGGTYRNANASFAVVRCAVGSAEINIYDGAVIDGNGQSRSILQLAGKVNINGGIIKNGVGTTDGGNIRSEGGTLTIKGGTIFGGKAANGGNIYSTNASLSIAGDNDTKTEAPQILWGTATTGNGGNIYTTSDLDLTNCTISEGKAPAGNGGNIAVIASSSAKATCNFGEGMLISGGNAKNAGNITMSYATVNMIAGEISGGVATGRSGNIEVGGSATLNINGGLIDGGTAALNGGNIYTSSTNSRVTMTGGTVSNGTANNSASYTGGGNFYINNGYLTVNGGVISGGRAPKGNGGNINCRTGMNNLSNKIVIDDDGNSETPKPLITDGVSKNTGGNIYVNGDRYDDRWAYITLGDCEITNGDSVNYTYGDDISLQHSGRLTVLPTFAGEADIYIPTCCLPADMTAGGAVDATAIITQGTFPGKLILEQFAKKYLLVGKTGSTQAYICDSGIKKEDGSFIWLTNNNEIIAAARENENCILQAAPGEMELDGGEYLVDLRGNAVHFTGSGIVTLIDSANDSYETFGSATAGEGVTIQTGMTKSGEKHYYTLEQTGSYSSHRLVYKLIKVSLRPSAGGIYYTGKWECDATIAEHIDSFGVAVSVWDMPQDDFATDGDTKWSFFEKNEFENGVEKTGVLISGILKDISEERICKNSAYAKMPIHAAAYITIDGNTTVSSGMAYSLHDVLEIIDTKINTYYKNASAMQNFMAVWSNKGLSGEDWQFDYIPSEDAVRLNELYAGRVAYHGEFHDHADTGGKSDGKASLSKIKEVMEVKNIDFTTILDHFQILHMELDDWDNSLFIGGSEMSTIIHDSPATGKSIHVNMIFSTPEEFKALMALHNPGNKYGAEGKFTWHQDEASGNWYYDEHQWSVAEFAQLIEDIRTCGGMYVFPHPKDGTRYISENPEDYWFADWTGLEVFYGPSYYAPTNARTVNAYKLWTDLLKLGKKMWATAGSDSHNLPNTNALTTIYSEKRDAATYLNHAKEGDMTCGPIGIRMCVDDTLTGGQTSFEGQRLTVCVGDFHESALFDGHTYRVDIIAGKGGMEEVVHSETIDPSMTFYYGMDTDNGCDYYRAEVYDESDTRITTGMPTAIGNPIWNEK